MVDSGLLRDRHVELVDGTIVEMPPEELLRASRAGRVARYLRQTLGDLAAVHEAYPVKLPHDGEPQLDIAVVRDRDYVQFERVLLALTAGVKLLFFWGVQSEIPSRPRAPSSTQN